MFQCLKHFLDNVRTRVQIPKMDTGSAWLLTCKPSAQEAESVSPGVSLARSAESVSSGFSSVILPQYMRWRHTEEVWCEPWAATCMYTHAYAPIHKEGHWCPHTCTLHTYTHKRKGENQTSIVSDIYRSGICTVHLCLRLKFNQAAAGVGESPSTTSWL